MRAIPHRKRNLKIRVAFLLAYHYKLKITQVLNCKQSNLSEPFPSGWKVHFLKELPIKKSSRSLQRWFKQYAKIAKLNSKYTFDSLRLKVTTT